MHGQTTLKSRVVCGFRYKDQIYVAEGINFCLLFNQRSIFIYYYWAGAESLFMLTLLK